MRVNIFLQVNVVCVREADSGREVELLKNWRHGIIRARSLGLKSAELRLV